MNAKLLLKNIARHDTTTHELADKMGISVNSFSKKLLGKRSFTIEEAFILCRILHIPLAERAKIFYSDCPK